MLDSVGDRSNLISNTPAGGNGGRSLSPSAGSIQSVAVASNPVANRIVVVPSVPVNVFSRSTSPGAVPLPVNAYTVGEPVALCVNVKSAG